MNFVALISGGKDSIFNILKCVENGHKLIAVANLYYQNEGQEHDSFMYQSVGTNVTQAIAEALGVPIFRKMITGKPVIQNLDYIGSCEQKSQDEVEDLFSLLKQIVEYFPQCQAVSSGAIASNYQRRRVENVCSRLNLISLAFLWGRQQDELVQEMIQKQMVAVLIKVSSFGLNETFLNQTLQENYEKFKKMKLDNIAGEGGEYESLTLDCPLYKKKIIIDEFEVVKHSDDPYAPVSYIVIKKIHLENK